MGQWLRPARRRLIGTLADQQSCLPKHPIEQRLHRFPHSSSSRVTSKKHVLPHGCVSRAPSRTYMLEMRKSAFGGNVVRLLRTPERDSLRARTRASCQGWREGTNNRVFRRWRCLRWPVAHLLVCATILQSS